MMATSLFLAKLVGLVFLLLGLFIVAFSDRMRAVGRQFLENEGLMFMAGVITLPIGLAIAIGHNVWVGDWRVLITLIGWIAIGAGIARLTMPRAMRITSEQMLENRWILIGPGAVMALLGAYLSLQGFFG